MYLWEQFYSQGVRHSASPVVFVPFWTGNFRIVGQEEGDSLSGLIVIQISFL